MKSSSAFPMTANEAKWRDDLTGVKNREAFLRFKEKLQHMLDPDGLEQEFAWVLCNLNDMKTVNETMGEETGDDYIFRACRMLCKVFAHSPVFRVGGDEFAVALMKDDYGNREGLLLRLRQQALDHLAKQDGPVLAVGMEAYDPAKHRSVDEVLEAAGNLMDEDKLTLKRIRADEIEAKEGDSEIIPLERRRLLDEMFAAFAVVAEGTYVFLCDMKYDYSRWSRTAVGTFNMPSEYMYDAGYLWEQRIHPEDRPAFHRGMDGIFFGGSRDHDMQYRAMNAEGKYVVCTCRGVVLQDREGNPDYFVGSIRNHGIQGQIDEVTGLRNQYGFFEDLRAEIRRHVRQSITMVGISRFSELNDVYGYQFGNRLLQTVGRFLLENIAGSGKVYRLDGPRFAVVGPTGSEEEIQKKYDLLRARFRDGFTLDDKYIILELNAGMVRVENFDIDDRTVYSCLNYSYGESKNRRQGDLVVFRDYINTENQHWIVKIQAIRASITQQFQGFSVFYQPVVNAESGRMIGAEALLRWENEEYGMVPPDEFIPVLERDSLFPELGQWILRTALSDAKKVMETHPDFIVHVNLSYTQLEKPGFVDTVADILKEQDFPPDNLCLEITERCRLLDPEDLKDVLYQLRARGVRIALDDFGTGFSSASLIRDLPLDTIKIDRSFVMDIEEDEKERELIGYFASVAAIYHTDVCAEGVETENMTQILRQYPIQTFQGYHYSRPLPFGEFCRWVEDNDG
ncbi:MAG: EAL domain-containing protein [Firmicutes bacterium]|nr:EAL domain-containing protein [Bacillota bacterium]